MKVVKLFFQSKNFLYKNSVRTYARYIPNDNLVNLNQNTLTGRLISYLKTLKTEEFDQKTEDLDLREAFFILNKNTLNISTLSNNKLINFIRILEDKELIRSTRKFYKVLKNVDTECCYRFKTLKPDEILNILDAYMDLTPNRITQLKFYKEAIDQLSSASKNLEKKDIIRFIFYIALMKKDNRAQKILKHTLQQLKEEDVNNLSSEELCIISNSTFKTSVKISNKKILDKIKNYLNDNLMLLKDPAIFVTLTKSLRHNRYFSDDLLASISCAMFFNKVFDFYTFKSYCHLLALYSDNLYYDENLLDIITKKCIEELRYGNEDIRGKDLERLLWGISNLNYTNIKKEDIKDVIVPKIMQMVQTSALDLNNILNIFLYLWMLKYKCYELVPYILNNKQSLNELPSNSRQRLNQLLTFFYHEDLPLFKKINLRPQGSTDFVLEQHLKNRPCLQNIMRSLKTIGPKMDMRFEVGYQIPYMNILGITGYTKNIYKIVNIEVLDNFTLLKNTKDRPTGLMQMKLRILDGSEEALLVVKEDEVVDLTEAQVERLLKDELELIC